MKRGKKKRKKRKSPSGDLCVCLLWKTSHWLHFHSVSFVGKLCATGLISYKVLFFFFSLFLKINHSCQYWGIMVFSFPSMTFKHLWNTAEQCCTESSFTSIFHPYAGAVFSHMHVCVLRWTCLSCPRCPPSSDLKAAGALRSELWWREAGRIHLKWKWDINVGLLETLSGSWVRCVCVLLLLTDAPQLNFHLCCHGNCYFFSLPHTQAARLTAAADLFDEMCSLDDPLRFKWLSDE